MTSGTPRILMVESGGWGGIGHYTHNICEALAKEGADIHLLSGGPYELDHLSRRFQLDVSLDPNQPYGHDVRRLVSRIRSLRPDAIHIQSTFAARRDWILWKALRLMGVRIVYTAHNVLPHDENERSARGMVWAYGRLYAIAEKLIVHGENIRSELLERFSPNPGKIHVIPHGDYGFVSPAGDAPSMDEARETLGLPTGRPTILAFGAIREYKGITELIDALPGVAARLPDVLCVVAGKPVGVDPEDYRAQARRLGVSDRLIIHDGYVDFDQIHLYFEAADVAAFPYRNIAQSGALQLAYAFAKPVVATAVGALPETVDHGQNGFLVPPQDQAALIDGLCQVLELDPDTREKMGQRSRELSEEAHDWTDCAQATLRLYEELLAT